MSMGPSSSSSMDGAGRRGHPASSSSPALGMPNGAGVSSSSITPNASSSGHKIAYDPRDLEERSDEHEMPKLTLMEEVLLVGLKE